MANQHISEKLIARHMKYQTSRSSFVPSDAGDFSRINNSIHENTRKKRWRFCWKI